MTILQTNKNFFTTTQKTLFFWAFFWNFPFPCFSCFVFFFFQHEKDKNKKCTFFFENPFFWHLDKLPKNYFRTPTHYLCFFKIPKNTIKVGKNKQKKISWTRFWRNLGPGFDSKNPKSWTRFWLYYYIRCFEGSFLLTVGAFLLTSELFCLQSM